MSKDIEISKYVKSIIESANLSGYHKENKVIAFYILMLKASADLFYKKKMPEDAKWVFFESQVLKYIQSKENNISNGGIITILQGLSDISNKMFAFYYDLGLLKFYKNRIDFGFSLDLNGIITNQDIIFTFALLTETIGEFHFKSKSEYAEVFEEFISQYAQIETKSNAESITPPAVNKLLAALAGDFNSFLDYTSGYGGLLYHMSLKNQDSNLCGIEINSITYELQQLRFVFNKNIESIHGNSLEERPIPIKTDVVAMVPPFNMHVNDPQKGPYIKPSSQHKYFGVPSYKNFNYGWLQIALSNLNDEGKAFVLLPQGSLVTSGKDSAIRKSLIEHNLVESIISLPGNLLYTSSIPSCIWVLNKNKSSNAVCFIETDGMESKQMRFNIFSDESIALIAKTYINWSLNGSIDNNDTLISITKEEIIQNGYSLNSSFYRNEIEKDKINNAKNISSLGEFIKVPLLKTSEKHYTISIKDLGRSEDDFKINIKGLLEKEDVKKHVLFSGKAVLFSLIGEKLKPSFLDTEGLEIAISKNIAVYQLKEDLVFLEYFIQELYKPYALRQFDSFRTGIAQRFISKKIIANVTLDIPVLITEQIRLSISEKEDRFKKLTLKSGFEDQLEKLRESQSADLGAKKHNINQHLNNVKSSADTLNMVLSSKKNNISIDDIINPNTGMTIEKRFKLMLSSLDKVIYFVDNLTNETSFGELEKVKLVKILDECIRLRGSKKSYTIISNFDEDIINAFVRVSKLDFEELFNNILENAENHGFVEDKPGYILKITAEQLKDSLVVRFENNGKPFPKGMDLKKYKTKGITGGAFGNDGIGAWKINEIVNYFDAELEIIDEPDNPFPVTIQITFKIEIDEV